jgi:periplasmic divalent cation tolerance protein
MSPQDVLLVFVTAPAAAAEALAAAVVEQRLAACVNLLPAVRSVYRWNDAVEQSDEALLLIKTSRSRYTALQEAVRQQHPYELPEIMAVHLTDGLPAYLDWIRQSTA